MGSNEETSEQTVHFKQESKKALEASQSKTHSPKEKVVPLPIDHFAKQGLAVAEARAQKKKELAEAQMPAGVKYFTNKAVEATVEVGEDNMTAAGVHFHRLALAEKDGVAQGEGQEMMPSAIQYFTLKAQEKKRKKDEELEKLKANPVEMPAGMAHFTKA